MKILIAYQHGIGDALMLGPCLRQLHSEGWEIDLVVPRYVLDSHVLDQCPYIRQATDRADHTCYDKTIHIDHKGFLPGEHKIDKNARELGIELDDRSLEVWPNEEAKEIAADLSEKHESYLFLHNHVPLHPYHSWPWSCFQWCCNNFEFDNVYQSGIVQNADINVEFEIMRRADYLVLCSSVFVHAAEAMGMRIDCINYGVTDPKVRPLDMSKVANIREEGKFIRRYYEWVE